MDEMGYGATTDSHEAVPAGYCYDERWLSVVDRRSEAWRAYCQARACVQRFLLIERHVGRERARTDWQAHLAAIDDLHGPRRAARLKDDFALVGKHEGAALRQAIADELHDVGASEPDLQGPVRGRACP